MTVEIASCRALIDEVPTIKVVCEAVSIIVSPSCTALFGCILPEVGAQIGMGGIDARVENSYDRMPRAVELGLFHQLIESESRVTPLLTIEGVAGSKIAHRKDHIIGFGIVHDIQIPQSLY